MSAWQDFLSETRLGARSYAKNQANNPSADRTTFQRDYDRIVFSSAFRRLHDKTQVFPLPDNAHVHSRLTHSLEVSCIGRSLGTLVGQVVIERSPELLRCLSARDFGDVVAAACLAHDIGNPPFGHAGEDAIQAWFRDNPACLEGLSDKEQADLLHFEGNAQGFRILTKLEIPANPGLQLTVTTLAAFMKYPRESALHRPLSHANSHKKHGFMQSERAQFQQLAECIHQNVTGFETVSGEHYGAVPRHPLTLLVEAADDICYSILDLEDGFELGYVSYQEARERLEAIAAKSSSFRDGHLVVTKTERREYVAYLRAKAISQLIDEVKCVFLDSENAILTGQYPRALTQDIRSYQERGAIEAYTRETCYCAKDVVEIELAGYKILHGFLSEFVPAALAVSPQKRQTRLLQMLPQNATPTGSAYERIQHVTDFVSSMTDSYAVSLFCRLTGTSLGSRRMSSPWI